MQTLRDMSFSRGPMLVLAATTAFQFTSPTWAQTNFRDTPYCSLAAPPALGLHEVSRRHLTDRLLGLVVHSDAMQADEHVEVLLPVGYGANSRTQYPVLYLLHGALDDYTSWPRNGVETLVGNFPAIVVMPEGGVGSSYSDWYGTVIGTSGTAPAWESFHVKELIPFIEANFGARTDRAGRFIAGLSSGGHGAMKYAAANPGLFGAAGEFSGAVNTTYNYPEYPIINSATNAITLIPGDGPLAYCTWGDFITQQVVWRDNDPTYLAGNLAGTPLFLTSGNGQPGPYDSDYIPGISDAGPPTDLTEWGVWLMNLQFVRALDAASVPHTDQFYGPGSHSWPYWKRDLQRFLDWLSPYLVSPAPEPQSFSVQLERPSFSAWGWQFAMRRSVREFVYLRDVSPAGLSATGSGELDVISAPVFVPGRSYSIDDGVGNRTVAADSAGRLHFSVDLGPSHTMQQTSFDATATQGWVTKSVVIKRRVAMPHRE